MTLWLVTRGDPLLFVLLSGLGSCNAKRNYRCLYIAQGIGAIFGGLLASQLHDATGSWVSVFFLLWQSRPI